MADFSKVLGYNAQRNRYYNLLIDSNGSLNVNVVSSVGGGGVLDQATATNQISQLNQATASNAAICSLLSDIAISGSSNSIPTIEASNLAITQRQDESLTEIQALNNKFVAYNSNLNVFDSQSVEELVNLNYKLSEAQNGGLPFYVQIGSDDAIQILGYNPNDAMSESVNCINGNLQVNDHLVNGQLITVNEQINLINVGIGEINGQLFNIDSGIQSTNTKLDSISTESSLLAVNSNIVNANTSINATINNFKPLKVQSLSYELSAAPLLAPLQVPQYTSPPDTLENKGWYFKNVALGQFSQLYYYSYLNTSAQVPARQRAYTISEITSSYAVVNILAINNAQGIPFLAVYSRPTASGDHQPWYKSRWTYSVPGSLLSQGLKVLLWWGTEPDFRLYPDIARIQCTLSDIVGPGSTSETLAYISLNTDSGALIGNSEYVVTNAGYCAADVYHDISFNCPSDLDNSNLAVTNLLATQNTITTSSNLAITTRLNNLATQGTLFICQGELESINGTSTTISNDLQNLNSIVSTETTLGLVKSELITLNNSDLAKDATLQSVDASLLFTNEKLDLVNTNLESSNLAVIEKLGLFNFDIDGNLKTTGSGGGGGGDATSANQISSNLAICQRLDTVNSALASTPGINTLLHAENAESPGDYLTLKATSTNGALLVQDILGPTADYQILSYDLQQFQSANAAASNLSICERLDTITVELESLANESTLQALEEKVITCNTDEVSIVNTPNVHCFGSSDGNNWHHILTTPQGKILVNSSTQDGDGENITSHIINTDRGLDTYIINPSIQVSNVWLPTLGSIDTKASTINSSIGQTNAYLASQSIQLNDIIIEQQSTNTSLSTIESAVATIESTIGTATQKVSIYSASESPINATSNALNVYQTNNPTSTNITASDSALTATGSSLNINQTNNPTSINITASGSALVATSSALNSYITNPKITVMSPGSSALGSRGNLWNNASVSAQSSTVNLNVDEFTTSVISYEDTSTAATSDILVFGRAFGSGAIDWQYLGKLIPILSSALSKRYAVGVFRLHQFAYIYLYNNSTTQALTNVYASVTSEYVA